MEIIIRKSERRKKKTKKCAGQKREKREEIIIYPGAKKKKKKKKGKGRNKPTLCKATQQVFFGVEIKNLRGREILFFPPHPLALFSHRHTKRIRKKKKEVFWCFLLKNKTYFLQTKKLMVTTKFSTKKSTRRFSFVMICMLSLHVYNIINSLFMLNHLEFNTRNVVGAERPSRGAQLLCRLS